MSGARGGGVPEPGKMRWLAFLVLFGIVGLAIWFAARWLIVLPLLAWVNVNYAILDAVGLLDTQGVAWRQFAAQAWDALMTGRLASVDLEWGTHLQPLHREVSERVMILWLPVMGLLALFIMFRSRGGGFRRVFLLTGVRKHVVTRFLGLPIRNGFLHGLLKLLATLTLTRKLVLSERKERQPSGPSSLGYQSLHWKTSSVALRFRQDGGNIPPSAMTPAEWILANVKPPNGAQRMSCQEFLAACNRARCRRGSGGKFEAA